MDFSWINYYDCCLLFLYFFLYAVIGWCCEVVYCSIPAKRFINRGFLNGPYCPIYGVGAIIIVAVLAKYINDPVSVFIAGMISTSALEYVTSWGMEKLFHAKWWDYSNHRFNLNGRICLLNSVLFGVMSLALMYLVHPFVSKIVDDFSQRGIIITSSILMVLMVADIIFSTLETLNFKNKLGRVSELATAVTTDLKDKGVDTKEQLEKHLLETREAAQSIRNNAQESMDELQVRMNEFSQSVSERVKIHHYSHSRIIKAFPNLKAQMDDKAVDVYRAALKRTKRIKRVRKMENKIDRIVNGK